MNKWIYSSFITLTLLSILLASSLTFAQPAATNTQQDEQEAYIAWAQDLLASLDRQTGNIDIGKAGASLNVPDSFYFLNSQDAEKVLVDVWGNPPGQNVLGMLFPTEQTPFDENSWAVTIEYEEDGYINDEDADDINYSDLLKEMKKDTKESSKHRQAQGYEAIELVGWASAPYYDAQNNKLHWAKEIKFGDDPQNTLNYNIRVLGRRGVLVLNFIASMDQKPIIDQNLSSVVAMADFKQGSQYSDFNPELDKVAAYGIGALVAGKLAAKAGLLAVILVFLKKFGIFILIGFGALAKKLFSSK